MTVEQALNARHCVRAFKDSPVDKAVIEKLIAAAARAPSGGNLQPWHLTVVTGASLDALKTLMRERTAQAPRGETMEYRIYPKDLGGFYDERRQFIGEAMYGQMGIAREDREARRTWFARNFQFFDAPVGLFCHVDAIMGPPQWSDLGMFLQSLMLMAVEAGLATCPQECWAMYPETLRGFLGLPADRLLFCGIALGYEDQDAPVNGLRSPRAALGDFVDFRD